MPGLERDPRDLMRARMKHRVDVAIRRDKRQKKKKAKQDVSHQTLAHLAEASGSEIEKYAVKQFRKDMKRNQKKYLTRKQLEVEIGNMVKSGKGKKGCYDFAYLNSKNDALDVSVNLKLNRAFAPRADDHTEAPQEGHATASVQSPEIDENIARAKRIGELKTMLHSCVQSRSLFASDPPKTTTELLTGDIPQYIPDTPGGKLLYLERLQVFGPIPENILLLHRVYKHLNPDVKYKPTDACVKVWAAKHWKDLHVSKDINVAEMFDAREAYSTYSTFAAASDVLQRARDDLERRRARGEAVVRGKIVARLNAKKPTARRNSIRSIGAPSLPQRRPEAEYNTTRREEAIIDDGSIATPSKIANGVNELENINGGVIRDLATDVDELMTDAPPVLAEKIEDELMTDAPVLAEKIVEGSLTLVSGNNDVVSKYHFHTSGEYALGTVPQFKELARFAVFDASDLRVQHSFESD